METVGSFPPGFIGYRAGGGVIWVVAALLLIACASPAAPAADASATKALGATPTREMAYDFTLTTLDGNAITLSDLRGEWVLINFWATWCPPCVREMPYLQELAKTHDLHILGINMDDSQDAATRFVEEKGIDFPVLVGADQVLAIAYNARGLPQTYVIAPDGTIALRIIGEIEPERFDAWLHEHDILRQ